MTTAWKRTVAKETVQRKSPGNWPALLTATDFGYALRNLLHRLGDAALDRLGGLGRDLLREASKLLALRRERLELHPRMRGGDLDQLGRRLHAEQLLDEGERCVGVEARDLDHLQAVFGRALRGGRIDRLERLGVLLGRGLELLVRVLALRHALLGELAEGGRNFELRHLERRDVELRHLEQRNHGRRGL